MASRITLALAAAFVVIIAARFVTTTHADVGDHGPFSYYGTVHGGSTGDVVLAFIPTDDDLLLCGEAPVIEDEEFGPGYVVNIHGNQTRAGCGSPGKHVRFYVASITGGRWNDTGVTIQSYGLQRHDLTALQSPDGVLHAPGLSKSAAIVASPTPSPTATTTPTVLPPTPTATATPVIDTYASPEDALAAASAEIGYEHAGDCWTVVPDDIGKMCHRFVEGSENIRKYMWGHVGTDAAWLVTVTYLDGGWAITAQETLW